MFKYSSSRLPPTNEVVGRKCFQSCLSVHICRKAGGWHLTEMRYCLLPLANEVWGKVMFLLSFCPRGEGVSV